MRAQKDLLLFQMTVGRTHPIKYNTVKRITRKELYDDNISCNYRRTFNSIRGMKIRKYHSDIECRRKGARNKFLSKLGILFLFLGFPESLQYALAVWYSSNGKMKVNSSMILSLFFVEFKHLAFSMYQTMP